MRILVTGGAGYVGSACLRWLLRSGHQPVAFDNLSKGNAAAVPRDLLVRGDIDDVDALAGAMAEHRAEAVMHFAAVASVPESIAQPERYWRTNVLGTKNVLDAMRRTGVARLLFSSTAATYAFRAPMPLREDSRQAPEVPYGTSKLAAEWLIGDYSRAYGLACGILRYFNAAGADPDGAHGESRRCESHLIPLVLAAALGQRDKVLIFGDDWDTRDGTCVRDYVHTDDLAAAHQLVLEAVEPGICQAYNVGSGVGTTVREIVDTCEAVVGRPIPHAVAPRRAGDPGTLIASPERLETELGWRPRHDVRSIIETAWRWHRDHAHGYGSADDA